MKTYTIKNKIVTNQNSKCGCDCHKDLGIMYCQNCVLAHPTTSKSEEMTDRQIQAEWKEQFEPRLENWEERFLKEFHYKGDGHWFHTVNVCADPEDVDKVTGTTDTAWAVPDSFKSFISTLLQEERGKILELAKECYEDVGDGGDPYVAQRNVGVAMVIGKIQQQ